MSLPDLISLILTAIFAWVSVRSVVYGVRLAHGHNRREMLAPCFGSICDGAGHIGVSLICIDTPSVERVADMLAVEYERYETVVVVDSVRRAEMMAELIERYSLVRVDYLRSEEFAASGCVRGLYRSRRRCFRRLTLVDADVDSGRMAVDAAADIAIYDYISVIGGDVTLLPYAVERLVAEICSSPEPVREVRTAAGAVVELYLRGSDQTEGSVRCKIYETLAVSDEGNCAVSVVIVVALLFAVAAIMLSCSLRSVLPAAAFAATVCAVVSSIIFSMRFVSPHLRGWKAFGYAVRNFCEKLVLKISQ